MVYPHASRTNTGPVVVSRRRGGDCADQLLLNTDGLSQTNRDFMSEKKMASILCSFLLLLDSGFSHSH
jgi:hypothetical protein